MLITGLFIGAGALAGCHHSKTNVATSEDVAKAEEQAQKEVQDARAEARKDLKNAVKQAGADSKNVEVARMTGSFDVLMAHADGDHKVAVEKCRMLAPEAQQTCKDQADAQYQVATENAKAARAAQTR